MRLPYAKIPTTGLKARLMLLLLLFFAAGAFGTLGDGKKKSGKNKGSNLLSSRSSSHTGYFSLKSGYNFRGNRVISNEKKYINLNTVVTVQKGKTTVVLPLRKKAFVDQIKIEVGNRQFQKH